MTMIDKYRKPRQNREKKPKRGFMDCYDRPDRQYDPSVSGFGNPSQWRSSFYQRMGFAEATKVVEASGSKAHIILGIVAGATKDIIKQAYRKMVKQYHPDRVHGLMDTDPAAYAAATTKMKEIQAAYECLMEVP